MSAAGERGGGSVLCLLVQAGDDLCAVPISVVRRVVRALPTHPLPGAGPELVGLAEFGGEPLAILDLARLLNAPSGAKAVYPVTVVVTAGSGQARELIGLAADAAVEIVAVPTSGIVTGSAGLVRGETTIGGRLVRIVDLEALRASQ
jgi:chemotaxis signal transduction protein